MRRKSALEEKAFNELITQGRAHPAGGQEMRQVVKVNKQDSAEDLTQKQVLQFPQLLRRFWILRNSHNH